MKRREFLTGTGALLLANVACDTTQSVVYQSPPAKQPVLTTLSSVAPRTCAWTDASPNGAGDWEILPSGHPSGDLRVKFQAPYPSVARVDVNGTFVLREFDNTQSPGEGYFRINSINLAGTQDTFDWDITVTPPASMRVEPQFRLNIADASINPAYTGADKTSAPLALHLVRQPHVTLSTWLAANQNVRDAIQWESPGGVHDYAHWTTQDQQFLDTTFSGAWDTNFPLLEDPPRNTVTLADMDDPITVIAEGDAWPLYVAHISYCLAAEIAGWMSWSITGYTSDQLAILFDSRNMFQWDSAHNGYAIKEGSGSVGVVPASPWTTLLFLYQNGLYTCRSQTEVIEKTLDWCRLNLSHFVGDFKAKNMEDQWQYRGSPPAVRVMNGTPFPTSTDLRLAEIMHRTAGCWGTTAFLRAILRVLNIPVKHEEHVGHSMPNFLTEGQYMSHGDDPYNRLSKATPPFPARELLIDQTTYDAWFGNGVAAADQTNNVGRRTRELAIKYLPDELLRNRCADIAANKSHADSDVFDSLKLNFTVAQLEALNLWDQIDAKLANLGGCAAFP
jgi:hypothetical protein